VCLADHSAKRIELIDGEPVYEEDIPSDDGEEVVRHSFLYCPLECLPDFIRKFFQRYQYQDKYPHTAKAYDEEYQWVLNASQAIERFSEYYQSKFKG
jgi:hypothetical protein